MTRNKLDAIRELYTAIERADMGGAFRFRDVEDMAAQLAKAARVLDRINVDRCNGIERWDPAARMRLASWTEEDEARAEKLALRHANAALAIVHRLNAESMLVPFSIRFNGDPRGASIKLYVAPDDPESGNASAYF
jgi:hypothetical protein